MAWLSRHDERLLWKIVGGAGSSAGASAPSRAGDRLRNPLAWLGFVIALALTGPGGRRAALRGAACSATAALVHLPVKRIFRRRRPLGAGLMGHGRMTTSFPSGHTASDLSFVFGASQELPPLIVPLSAATLASHWSLLRSRKHYPSDVVAGGAIALAVAAAAWMLRPPRRRSESDSATAGSVASWSGRPLGDVGKNMASGTQLPA